MPPPRDRPIRGRQERPRQFPLQGRVIELVITSTPHEEFRKELLAKPKGHSLKCLLEYGRKYEAFAESSFISDRR